MVFAILGPDFRQDHGGAPVLVARGFARSYQRVQTIWSDDPR
ncbi:hypothetical protein C8J25_10441 [Sphingomonas faeni]|uniref:Uncharacterized protein n=1 Tax=Sphingomonas faeni TaxID=185950 RepID=A0A2T5U5B8_9SPHN|nr:hypothetical protein C8J25_10441 [Sphingomonas faeni]